MTETPTKIFQLVESAKREMDALIVPAVIDAMQHHLNPSTGLCDCRAEDLAGELGTNRRTLETLIDKLVKDGRIWHVQRATDAFGKAIVRAGRRVTNGYFPWKTSQVLCSQDCANPPKGLAHWATSLNSVYDYKTTSIGCRVSVCLYLQDSYDWATSPKGIQRADSPKGIHPPELAIALQSLSASQRVKTLETEFECQQKELGLASSVTQRTERDLEHARAYLDDLAKWKHVEGDPPEPQPIEPQPEPVKVVEPEPVRQVIPTPRRNFSPSERQELLEKVEQLRAQAAAEYQYPDERRAKFLAKADEIERELGGLQ